MHRTTDDVTGMHTAPFSYIDVRRHKNNAHILCLMLIKQHQHIEKPLSHYEQQISRQWITADKQSDTVVLYACSVQYIHHGMWDSSIADWFRHVMRFLAVLLVAPTSHFIHKFLATQTNCWVSCTVHALYRVGQIK